MIHAPYPSLLRLAQHQPFYKDLVTGEYRLPWTRYHALKDYYGMVKILEEFPDVHQTFNLVPSMIVQVQEYAAGQARDPFLDCAVKPAESLTEAEQEFVLRYFFQANADRMIYRYPRYGELYDAWQRSGRTPQRARRIFSTQDLRDLQVLSQLAWFDEEFQAHDPEVKALIAKERNYSFEDQARDGAQAARNHRAGRAGAQGIRGARADRDLHHALLPSDSAVDLRLQHRRRFASRRSARPAGFVILTTRAIN